MVLTKVNSPSTGSTHWSFLAQLFLWSLPLLSTESRRPSVPGSSWSSGMAVKGLDPRKQVLRRLLRTISVRSLPDTDESEECDARHHLSQQQQCLGAGASSRSGGSVTFLRAAASPHGRRLSKQLEVNLRHNRPVPGLCRRTLRYSLVIMEVDHLYARCRKGGQAKDGNFPLFSKLLLLPLLPRNNKNIRSVSSLTM